MLLVDDFCLPFLLGSQNPDGGWGYRPGLASGVEPTCWALLALRPHTPKTGVSGIPMHGTPDGVAGAAARIGYDWLHATQLPDGSWPAFPEQASGCWVTALSGLALRAQAAESFSNTSSEADAPGDSLLRAVRWLCNAWPAEWKLWSRIRHWWQHDAQVNRQDPSLRGWSWTPNTASWVEPTALALLLLKSLPPRWLPPSAGKRIHLGESMLLDRMCPGGGWNAGNPLVYNVAGVPRVIPTVWALLALQTSSHGVPNTPGSGVLGRQASVPGSPFGALGASGRSAAASGQSKLRTENRELRTSLDWLEQIYGSIRGPGSLALAHLCLTTNGRSVPPLEPMLQSGHDANNFLMNTVVVSWVTLALNGQLGSGVGMPHLGLTKGIESPGLKVWPQ